MDRYSLGKASLRIALQRLVQSRLISSIPRQGYRIAPVTVKDVEEIFCLRLLIEPYAARLAAGRVNRAQLERLEQICRGQMPGSLAIRSIFSGKPTKAFTWRLPSLRGTNVCNVRSPDCLTKWRALVALGFGAQGVRPNIERDHTMLIEHLARGCRCCGSAGPSPR